jgi:hypothetical protein
VVAVGAVLALQFPVAVIDIGRGAAQHLETVGRLVDQQVDDLGGFTEPCVIIGEHAVEIIRKDRAV